MRILIIIFLLFISTPSSAIEITNFKSGLACTNSKLTKDGTGWICQPTIEVLVTDQGRCVYNGKTNFCTWVGYEFDFKAEKELTKIQCNTTFSKPLSLGNPENVTDEEVTSQDYELELKGKSGHFYNPQYFIFDTRPNHNLPLAVATTCKVSDKVVFQYHFNIKFPTLDN
ncbi:MAG: hypothetical protein ACREO1_07255 [Arenimonas sp.]